MLLLDEPLSALDPFLRCKMRAELRRWQRELGIFIHVTHAPGRGHGVADLVVVMNGGRIEQQGTPREVFHRPRTEFVARFIGGHNVVAVRGTMLAVRADRARLSPWTEAAAEAGGLGRHRERSGVPGRASCRRGLTAADGTELVAVASEEAFDRDPLKPGARVTVAWDAEDAHALA